MAGSVGHEPSDFFLNGMVEQYSIVLHRCGVLQLFYDCHVLLHLSQIASSTNGGKQWVAMLISLAKVAALSKRLMVSVRIDDDGHQQPSQCFVYTLNALSPRLRRCRSAS